MQRLSVSLSAIFLWTCRVSGKVLQPITRTGDMRLKNNWTPTWNRYSTSVWVITWNRNWRPTSPWWSSVPPSSTTAVHWWFLHWVFHTCCNNQAQRILPCRPYLTVLNIRSFSTTIIHLTRTLQAYWGWIPLFLISCHQHHYQPNRSLKWWMQA